MTHSLVRTLIVFTALMAISGSQASAAGCAKGKITCQEWCGKYGGNTCMTGHPNSCDKKPQGNATCVNDRGR